MKKYYMGYRYINILRVMLMLLLIVIIILRKYILYNYQMSKIISIFKETMIGKILWIMIVIAESVYILYVLICIPLLYKRTEFYISDEGIGSRTGLFIKSNKYIKMNSIQKVSLITAPFSDKTGFNFIVFNGYGGRIVFTFISQKESYEIIYFVKKKINKQK